MKNNKKNYENMKKLVLTILLSVVWVSATAQVYDTIHNRADNGYYHRWYDTCARYLSGGSVSMINLNLRNQDSTAITVISKFTPQPLTITGGIIMVRMEARSYYWWQYERVKPEYLMLYQYDAKLDTMLLIDSARWDTLTPKIMELPLGVGGGYAYCYGYEALFDSPVTVDSTFYMGGTQNNNVYIGVDGTNDYLYEPVEYCMIAVTDQPGCIGDTTWVYKYDSIAWRLQTVNYARAYYGGVIPTVPMFSLDVVAEDSTHGSVEGGGRFANLSTRTISAVAADGYRFAHWNDGSRDNPRQVLLTQDTLFTAYFVERNQVWADVRSNDESLGTATGGGVYYEGDTATLTATAMPYNKFLYWDDAVRDNPREVEMTQDTLFTAVFGPLDRYRVEAYGNSGRGYVEGGGEYYEGDTVTLTAVPWTSFGFLQWDDGDTANPRSFVVTQDTVFNAIFVSREAIEEAAAGGTSFQLLPNPAKDNVRCVLYGKATTGGIITFTDAMGREVLRKELPRQTASLIISLKALPKGVYFVTLATAEGSSVRKLVVE